MGTPEKSDEIDAAEMRPAKMMARISLGRSPASPYEVLRAEWLPVHWAMETRWYYQAHPEATLGKFV